ncbi:MAG: UDP-N-acetylmuramate dehydrogenase [Elusimicrobiota bacterium]
MLKKYQVPLGDYTGFGCGGEADMLVKVSHPGELKDILNDIRKKSKKWYLLGDGYNTLAGPTGFRGVVILLTGKFKEITVKNNRIMAGAGVKLSTLLNKAVDRGLGGLEFLAGIPGTVGGGIIGNSGTQAQGIGNKIDKIEIFDWDKLKLKKFKREDLNFKYREFSIIENINKFVITRGWFCLKRKNKTDIISKVKEYKDKKRLTQPLKYRSCGCIFKNPEKDDRSAGELIEKAGLKGFKRGDAKVSEIHANYIVNLGNATSEDILFIINKIRKKIKNKFNLELRLEINIIGETLKNYG